MKIETRIVSGISLRGLIDEGQIVKIFFGYYACHIIERGDIIAYHFSGDMNPIIKIVKGVPGDRFQLQKVDGGWSLLINGGIVRNSMGKPYLFNERAYRLLSLYESDFRAVIPPSSYIILGNLPEGSLDSSRVGLVGKSDILGKVVSSD